MSVEKVYSIGSLDKGSKTVVMLGGAYVFKRTGLHLPSVYSGCVHYCHNPVILTSPFLTIFSG